MEGCGLNLRKKHNKEVRRWEIAFGRILLQANRLSHYHVECEPRLNACDSLHTLRVALGGWHVEHICFLSRNLLLINGAEEHRCLEDDQDCEDNEIVAAQVDQHLDILGVEAFD